MNLTSLSTLGSQAATYMVLGNFGGAVTSAIILNAKAQKAGIDVWSWTRHLITPVSPFPKEFLEQIEDSNREKPDAPLALVLQAEEDYNGTFSSPAQMQLLSKIAETHRIAIKVISNSFAWRRSLREADLEFGEKIPLFCSSGHGSANTIRYGATSIWNFFNLLEICNLHTEDFDSLTPDAIIILDSCKVGQELASKMAEISKRTVLAAKTETASLFSVFHENSGSPQLFSYDAKGNMLTHAFFPDGRSEQLTVPLNLLKSIYR